MLFLTIQFLALCTRPLPTVTVE